MGVRRASCPPGRLARGEFSISSFDGDDDFLRLPCGNVPCSKLFSCGHVEARWSLSTSPQQRLLTSVSPRTSPVSPPHHNPRGVGEVVQVSGRKMTGSRLTPVRPGAAPRGRGAGAARGWPDSLSPPASLASDVAPRSKAGAGGGGFLPGSTPAMLGICFHLLIFLLSCKVLNVIILPFLKQEKKLTACAKEIFHLIWHPATVIGTGCSLGAWFGTRRSPVLFCFQLLAPARCRLEAGRQQLEAGAELGPAPWPRSHPPSEHLKRCRGCHNRENGGQGKVKFSCVAPAGEPDRKDFNSTAGQTQKT